MQHLNKEQNTEYTYFHTIRTQNAHRTHTHKHRQTYMQHIQEEREQDTEDNREQHREQYTTSTQVHYIRFAQI